MLEVSKIYILKINAGNVILKYKAEILAVSEGFITFKDIKGDVLHYNLNAVLGYEEVRE